MAEPQPLDRFTPIANPDGTPTEFFMRLLQNRGILQDDVQAEIDEIKATEILGGTGIDGGGPIGDGNITLDANTQEILDEISSTQGSVLYRGASAWGSLGPGTAGQFFQTQGPAADPVWAAGGGGGSAAWTLAGSWTYSVAVPNVDFTGLGDYNELLFFMRGVSASSSGLRRVLFSVDGGSSFYNTSGDYERISNAGASVNENEISLHGTDSSAARSGAAHILNNLSGAPKAIHRINRENSLNLMFFIASPDVVNAIRFDNNAGGNLTAGTAFLFGR